MERGVIHNPSRWEHQESMSCYNHNYYRNRDTGELILEDCDEFYGYCTFYEVTATGEHYLGDAYADSYEWSQEEDIILEEFN